MVATPGIARPCGLSLTLGFRRHSLFEALRVAGVRQDTGLVVAPDTVRVAQRCRGKWISGKNMVSGRTPIYGSGGDAHGNLSAL